MNLKDIALYTNRLLKESALGWSDQPKLLAQFMGFRGFTSLNNRINGPQRMTLGEQQRASAALERILKGEIRCEQRLFRGKVVGDVVEVDNPTPLFGYSGYRCTVDVGNQGVKLSVFGPERPKKGRILPSFRSLLWPS